MFKVSLLGGVFFLSGVFKEHSGKMLIALSIFENGSGSQYD